MRTIVIYPGRFHPFHRGHRASYDYLVNKFGANNVYVATSAKQAPVTSPFSYSDKVQMMTKLGIPAGKIVQVVNPYQAEEILKDIPDPENTQVIFAVSEKDMAAKSPENPDGPRFRFGLKKNGEPTKMQPMPEDPKKMQSMDRHTYVMVTPTVNFRVKGADANSASEIRKRYIAGNDSDRDQIIADLYGEVDPELRDIFDRRLGLVTKTQNMVSEARKTNSAHGLKLIEKVLQMERAVHLQDQEDVAEDYIEERWSQKYKRSINCARPRGFSQRAHCAGRKK